MSLAAIVVDYGVGNVHSVLNALAHEGGEAKLSADLDVIRGAPRLVLPGVGAFGDGMRELEKRGLVEAIRAFAATGRPLLGICLGMQMLLDASTEFGLHEGLGIVPGKVDRIPVPASAKVPHVGWSAITPPLAGRWSGTLLGDVGETSDDRMVYFVHSFHAEPSDAGDVLATVKSGGVNVTAAVQRENVTGFQFHPEKSGPLGLSLIRRFVTT